MKLASVQDVMKKKKDKMFLFPGFRKTSPSQNWAGSNETIDKSLYEKNKIYTEINTQII